MGVRLRRPDPRGEQMKSLQTLLARLAAGEEDGVESHWMQQLIFRENVRVRAKDWKTHLEHMFVCKCACRHCARRERTSKLTAHSHLTHTLAGIDYCSMPR